MAGESWEKVAYSTISRASFKTWDNKKIIGHEY